MQLCHGFCLGPSSKVMTCHIQNKLLMVPDSGIRGMFSITSIRLSDTVFVNTADNNCLPPQVGDPPSPMASYCFDKCQMSLAERELHLRMDTSDLSHRGRTKRQWRHYADCDDRRCQAELMHPNWSTSTHSALTRMGPTLQRSPNLKWILY